MCDHIFTNIIRWSWFMINGTFYTTDLKFWFQSGNPKLDKRN